jgi:hypothetical protein
MTEIAEQEKRTHFWQALSGIAFTMWALMVPISAKWVVDSLSTMSDAEKIRAEQEYRRNELMEGRMSRLETKHEYMMEEIRRMQMEHLGLRAIEQQQD